MTSRLKKGMIGGLVTILAITFCVKVQHRLDTLRNRNVDEELQYLPNEKLLNHFTVGMGSVIADVLWVRCINYTATHFRGDGRYLWLNHMCNMITRLDPHFVAAYRYGGMFLASVKADDDASIRLLQQGMRNNPYAWELPYEIAMTWLLNRGTWPNARTEAARYLGMAVATGRAPHRLAELAAAIQQTQNLDDVERAMWESNLDSDDKFMRDLATRKLIELELRLTCRNFNKAADTYRTQHGTPPKQLDDLVQAGLLSTIPQDPLGGTFFIDAGGTVQSSTLIQEAVQQARNTLANLLEKYKKNNGSWPSSLQQLMVIGVKPDLLNHPVAGQTWKYNPATGTIE